MMIVHDVHKTASSGTINSLTREKAESEQIINAFEDFESENDAVTVDPLTVVSPYATIHEDVFNLAKEKQVAMIFLPYHKQLAVDGRLQDENHSLKEINKNILVNPPCSVGILVDRGLRSSIRSDSVNRPELRFAMLFIGGSDDQEALSYAWKMAGTHGVILSVIRFLASKEAEQIIMPEVEKDEEGILTAATEMERAREYDDEFINEFRFKTMCAESIIYHEKLVNGSDEVVECIATKYNNFDLYIVGRGERAKSPITMALSEWSSESPELGLIGETLVSSQFTHRVSVLVVQQAAVIGLRTGSSRHKGKCRRKN